MAALSLELRRRSALAARLPDPDDEEAGRLVSPVRNELRQLADKLESRAR
jgi:hypothetical protein